jgi:hypothetical protein
VDQDGSTVAEGVTSIASAPSRQARPARTQHR